MSWMSPLTVPITILPWRGAPLAMSSGPQHGHAGLHRVGGEQNLRHEQDAVAEVDADDAHALDEAFGQRLVRRPATAEQDVDAFDDLVLQAVVEVLVHLFDERCIVEVRENDFVVGHATEDPRMSPLCDDN